MTATASQLLWLPGTFPSTNALLDLQRTTGYYAGRGAVQGQGFKPRKSAPEKSFPAQVQAIRAYAKLAARGARLVRPPPPVFLEFWLLGHPKYDASAWTLAAKAVEDGLVDAKVLHSDRFDVEAVSGGCARSEEVAQQWARLHGLKRKAGEPGLLVVLGGLETLPREVHGHAGV